MRVVATLVTVLMLAVVAPATADHNEDHNPEFRTERVYFHCQDDNKLMNIAAVQGDFARWNTSPPAASVTDGAGCGQAEYVLSDTGDRRNPHDVVYSGTFTGNLRDMTIQLHDMSHTAEVDFEVPIYVSIYVDGFLFLDMPGGAPQSVPAEPENSGVTHKLVFSVVDLGFDEEDGVGTIERDIDVVIRTAEAALLVWDTTEVPAGITFNPTSLSPIRIRA